MLGVMEDWQRRLSVSSIGEGAGPKGKGERREVDWQ
jgi:hypothetical protein